MRTNIYYTVYACILYRIIYYYNNRKGKSRVHCSVRDVCILSSSIFIIIIIRVPSTIAPLISSLFLSLFLSSDAISNVRCNASLEKGWGGSRPAGRLPDAAVRFRHNNMKRKFGRCTYTRAARPERRRWCQRTPGPPKCTGAPLFFFSESKRRARLSSSMPRCVVRRVLYIISDPNARLIGSRVRTRCV